MYSLDLAEAGKRRAQRLQESGKPEFEVVHIDNCAVLHVARFLSMYIDLLR